MSDRPHRSHVQYGTKQEPGYYNLQQLVASSQSFQGEYSKPTDIVAKARPIHGAQLPKEAHTASSSASFSEEETLKQRKVEAYNMNSPIFEPLSRFTVSVLKILLRLKSDNRTVVSALFKQLFLVAISRMSKGENYNVSEVVRKLLSSVGLGPELLDEIQKPLLEAISSLVFSLSKFPPSEVTGNKIEQTMTAVQAVMRQKGPLFRLESNTEQQSSDNLSHAEDINTKKPVRTRSSLSVPRSLSGGVLEDYGDLYGEDDQDTAANFSVTGINNNIVDGFTEEMNALIPSLSERLERFTRASHIFQWDEECLEVLATGLQKQITNLIDRAKDIAVKRVLESEIMSHLQQNERQDPRYELEEIRKEELRQIEAIMEANKKRDEEEEDWRESQRIDSSNKRKASDSPFESGENTKRSRKRQSGPSSTSESLQKTNEALNSSIQGLLKKRREQARLSLLKPSGDTKNHSSTSHENESETKRLFKMEPEKTNVSISIRDVIFVLERDAVCRKSGWFYSKCNSQGTLTCSERRNEFNAV